jgi:Carbohydrate esterase, sialic acid-specific acetylesterase/Secretion system C-terminal sorting domain/Fibronectin type III domain
MKISNTLLIFLLLGTSVKAQKYFATTFDKLPQNYQLYPRNEQNEALVPISGKIEETGWDYFSVQIFRNKQLVGYQKAPVTYTNSVGKFSFSSIKIKAEKAEYDFKIYAVRTKDSLNLTNRENIVSGDVYIMSGQSNATVFFNDTRKNEYCRTFGKISGNWGIENANPADTLWALSNQDAYNQGVGTMGFEFQQTILEKYGIPTCLINGGFNWSSMKQHATRNANNAADLTNGYGRMLYRIQKAGVAQSVKAMIYRQGETEAYGEGTDWGGNFDIYYKNLKTDLPSIKKIYLFQIDIIDFARPDAPQVRDIQRKEADKYADIQIVASIGTPGFDGLHYTPEGYSQNAQEFSRLVGRDFYNSSDTDNINAPNIRKAFFSNKEKTEITLQFDNGQDLSWTDQVRNLLMKNQYYLNGINGVVSSGLASGNQVVLKLYSPTSASLISYLPPLIDSKSPDFPYTGPYIKNKRGLRALSFYEVKIEPFVPIPTVSFSKIPQNLQVFPRNAKNEALVSIAGKIETVDYNTLSLLVFRNNSLIKYNKSSLNFTGNVANFSFSHTIKAELANYTFKLYAIKGVDSVLVTSRDNIVSGDTYLINGQSNAAAWGVSTTFPNSDYRNEFCRTFGQAKSGNAFITEADTTWALSNNGKPFVGVWGIELQKQIVEKYGIPICFINEAISGSAITEHTIRDAANPANVSNVYGRLLYRAKKSGHFDALKGFFYWQGEAEAIDKPAVWKPEFEKLYSYWKTDYPTVGKFYIFQINITGFPFAEAADLRDYQRQIKKIFPKTEVIATIGNSGYDGGHYTVDGYKKIATDVFKLVSRDFYNSTDTIQITSPNVQKVYYSTIAKDEITILFEDAQKMVWTPDSTYKQDDGTPKKYFMKDYIYLNNATDKVISGRAENNKIILKTSGYTGNQTLTYLPPYYPLNYPVDLRGIFGGPFLKNQRGMSALSFNKQVIADPLNIATLSAKIQTAIAVQLTWKDVSNATSYQLEIKDLQGDKYNLVKLLPKGTITFLVDNLAGNTNYTFRIKAISDNIESEYSSVQIQTSKALDLPNLTAIATGIESVKLSWKSVNEAVNYVIERKNLTTNSFEQIAKVEANIFEYNDKSLKNSTLYSYRIKAIGTFTESAFVNTEVKTLIPLQSPEPTLTVLYFNSLQVNWKAVPNANSFILERKTLNQEYKILGIFDPNVLSFTDKDLSQNTLYTYRIKAVGGITESLLVTVEGTTPSLLSTPELIITSSSYDVLKITWKPIQNATQYILEKKNSESEDYKELAKLDASKTEFTDISLKEKTTYLYRLKAYGDKTESDFTTAKGTTATILAIEEEIFGTFELFPNPSNTQVTLRFSKPTTGQISIVDLTGVEIFTKDILKTNELAIQLTDYQSGSYVFIFQNQDGMFSKKLIIN